MNIPPYIKPQVKPHPTRPDRHEYPNQYYVSPTVENTPDCLLLHRQHRHRHNPTPPRHDQKRRRARLHDQKLRRACLHASCFEHRMGNCTCHRHRHFCMQPRSSSHQMTSSSVFDLRQPVKNSVEVSGLVSSSAVASEIHRKKKACLAVPSFAVAFVRHPAPVVVPSSCLWASEIHRKETATLL